MALIENTATKTTTLNLMNAKHSLLHKPQWLNNRYFLIATVFYIAMFVLGSMRVLEHTLIWTFNDKLLHFAAYFFLTGLVYIGLGSRPSGQLFLPRVLWSLIIVSGAGALDEFAQAFVGRDSSFDDWLADTAASITLLLLISVGHVFLVLLAQYRDQKDEE